MTLDNQRYVEWRTKFVEYNQGFARGLLAVMPRPVSPFTGECANTSTFFMLYTKYSELCDVTVVTRSLESEGGVVELVESVLVGNATADLINNQGGGYIEFRQGLVVEASGIFAD